MQMKGILNLRFCRLSNLVKKEAASSSRSPPFVLLHITCKGETEDAEDITGPPIKYYYE